MYKFFDNEKKFYEGFTEHGPEINLGDPFLDGGLFDLRFKCPKCNYINTAEAVELQKPNMLSDTAHDSQQTTGYDFECGRCSENYIITTHNTYAGLFIQIEPELPDYWKTFLKLYPST